MEALNNNKIESLQNDIYINPYTNSQNRTRSKSRAKARVNFYKAKVYFILSASIISSLLILSVVLGYTEMVAINSNNKLVQAENEDLKLAIDSLELKLSPFASKERIEKIASTRLGMVYPGTTNIVIIEKSSEKSAGQKDQVELAEENQGKAKDESLLSFVNGLIRWWRNYEKNQFKFRQWKQ